MLYYVPTPKPLLSAEDLKSAGIAYVGEPGIPAATQCLGPDGGQGLVFAACPNDPGTFKAAEQRWTKGPDGKFWCGVWIEKPNPGPDKLARKKFVGGHAVRLRDGNDWTIPIARSVVGGSTLPRGLVLGDDAKTWRMKELPEYLKLCKDAEAVWREYVAAVIPSENGEPSNKVEVEDQELIRIAVDGLAANYRIGPLEVSCLGLLGTDEMWEILRAIIDIPALMKAAEDRKKKDLASAT